MGLSIQLGTLAGRRADLEVVNRVLGAAGLPPHEEPADPPKLRSRASCTGFPYSFVHYLRRVYAQRHADEGFVAEPLPSGEDPSEDDRVEELCHDLSSHLVCHSDCGGFYVPLPFHEVLGDDDLEGGMLGSSQRLLAELVECAPALGICLDAEGRLSDEEAARVNQTASKNAPLFRELTVWIALYEAARLSIEHRTAIVFA